MPAKKSPPQYGSKSSPHGAGQARNSNGRTHFANEQPSGNAERITASESLRATAEEKHATSKSLYGDHAARISSNVSSIHDHIRPRAYQSVLRNIKGKSLLHIGCGMGLISMMAARSLASVVVAVDRSAIVDAAQVVAKQNGLENISFFRGSLRETMSQFPVQRFDVILCEWMGTFLVNEPILEDALFARDNLLAANGVMCPDGSSVHVVGVSDYPFYLNTVDYWSNVYGFKMEPMKELVWREVETCSIPACNIVTNSCMAHTVNVTQLLHATENNANNKNNNNEDDNKNNNNNKNVAGVNDFTASFTIRATEDTTVNFLTFYVDATFTNPHNPGANFVIGIRPGGTNAWTETSVALQKPLPLRAGEAVSGELRVRVLDLQRGVAAVDVTARTEGRVVPQETTGSYVYQRN